MVGVDAGLGFAATAMQVHLGVGLVLMFTATAVRSGTPLKSVLEGSCWETSLRAAAQASSSVPLMVAHALIQVRGGALDKHSWVGLLAATTAIVLGSAVVLVGPLFAAGSKNGIVNGAKNGVTNGNSNGNHQPTLAKTLACARMMAVLRGAGLAALPFGGLPGGVQLQCATILVRLALLVHAGGAFAVAVGLQGSTAELLADLEKITGLAPMVSCLTLLDHITQGPGEVMDAMMQPVVYCVFASLVQVVLVFLVKGCLSGSMGSNPAAEFDMGFALDTAEKSALTPQLERIRRAVSVALYAAAGVVLFFLLQTSFKTSMSTKGFSVEWGESPLLATASLLQTLIFAVYGIEFLALRLAGQPKQDATNGVKAGPGVMSHVKAIVSPAQSLVLALILLASFVDSGKRPSVLSLLPRYGFVGAAVGVALQVISLGLFTMAHANDYPPKEPQFDCSGTLEEGSLGGSLGSAASVVLLQGGIAVGLVGLGFTHWLLVAGPIKLVIFFMLPKAAKDAVFETLGAFCNTLMDYLGNTFSFVGDYLDQRRATLEASKAKQAAELAAQFLEEEDGKKGAKKKKEQPTPKKEEQAKEEAAEPEQAQEPEEKGAAPKKKKGVNNSGGFKKRK